MFFLDKVKMSDHFDSSDDDMEEIAALFQIPKNVNYFEEIVPQLNDQQYLHHFRINRHVTQQLAEQFELSEWFHYQEGDSKKISALKFMTIFLWFAANETASYRDVSDRFNISIIILSPQFINWPINEEKNEIEAFFRQNGFAGVIGVIDGTHIRIDKPADDPDSYLNRKHFYSIQAQVVCDHRKRIRDIFVGYPGSVHDSRVFRTSPLCETLHEKCGNFFIIGDIGYPCLTNLLTPFKDRGQLTRHQRNYNYKLSQNRYLVEHCFGYFKQKFRQLYHIKLRKIPNVVHFIRACAVLHNLSIEDEFLMQEDAILPDQQFQLNNLEEDFQEDDRNGITKRNEVMNSLGLEI
ncbi:hypothetical protein NQ314_018134 [Rhamnusium bicolor]|uniref:DDE Tnp4 domain-containing protein n=1 Tax=Rhamnusium bicolor TaxID=1586634 RepID=A0AAV8WQZ3_9CUCU|nr:hypothetical protein NQ314_018134 [Rhamnusium bicolor]